MITVRDAIYKIIVAMKGSLMPTEPAIQTLLFYANVRYVKETKEPLWSEDCPAVHWKVVNLQPHCDAITDVLQLRQHRLVKKRIIEKDLPPTYVLIDGLKTPDPDVKFDQILKDMFAGHNYKHVHEIIMRTLMYISEGGFREGDTIEIKY